MRFDARKSFCPIARNLLQTGASWIPRSTEPLSDQVFACFEPSVEVVGELYARNPGLIHQIRQFLLDASHRRSPPQPTKYPVFGNIARHSLNFHAIS